MSQDEKKKSVDVLAWIASVAVSVLCCSAIFVVFASHIIDVKNDVKDVTVRLNVIEKEQQQLTMEQEMLQKRLGSFEKTAMPVAAADAVTPAAPVAIPVAASPLPAPPAPPAMPETPIVAPAPTVPSVTVPVLPSPADKK